MKAHVTVRDFGTREQCQEVVDQINKNTMFHAYITQNRNAVTTAYPDMIVIPVNVPEIGELMGILSRDVKLNWIEYNIQFL